MSAFFLLRMNDHIQYLKRLKATLEGHNDFMGCDQHSCKLGKWLECNGSSEADAVGPEARQLFNQLIDPHTRFHQAGQQALDLKLAGQSEACKAKVTEMHQLSATLVDLLLRLDLLAQRHR